MSGAGPSSSGPSRREFLGAGAALALGATLWRPRSRIAARAGQLPGFPARVELYRQSFENWSGEIAVDDLWTCAPRTSAEVLRVVEWARRQGARVRPRGMMHNWSPLSIPATTRASQVVMVDTTRHLNAITVDAAAEPSVRVQSGALLEAILAELEAHGYGFTATPAPGDLTIGGALAIGGHGSAIRARGERRPTGSTYGSLSNSLLSLTAIVWDPARGRYVERTFERADPGIDALLVHVGRSFLTEARLQVGPNQRLRCESRTDIEAAELLGAPGAGSARTLQTFLEESGRVEVIWFPYTTRPWLKVWSRSPERPASAREVDAPFNYPFSQLPAADSDQLMHEVLDDPARAVSLGSLSLNAVDSGLRATASADLWGWSKNLLLYVRPDTLRYSANGYAILCRRPDVQAVVHDFVAQYQRLVAVYEARGQYPMNGPMEIRVTGLDQPGEVVADGARPPTLSALKPRPDHPEWDVAVWLDLLTFPGTAHASEFMAEVESWIFSRFSGDTATVRPEWSKGWAYSTRGPWTNAETMRESIPTVHTDGQRQGSTWSAARRRLERYDPHGVFGNAFLDDLFDRR
jgi:FAD/FMN-containing dehydrogenase